MDRDTYDVLYDLVKRNSFYELLFKADYDMKEDTPSLENRFFDINWDFDYLEQIPNPESVILKLPKNTGTLINTRSFIQAGDIKVTIKSKVSSGGYKYK